MMFGNRKIVGRSSMGDQIFMYVVHSVLFILFLVVLYPLLFVVSASFSDPTAVISGKVLLFPVNPTLIGYEAVFKYRQVWTGYSNSLFYMLAGTTINVLMTVLAAYPLSRKSFYGRNAIMGLFVFTMFFGGGLIPSYLLVRSLGMIDTRWAMLIPNAMAVWNVIIARTFFQSTIPDELLEAAHLDGCSDIKFISLIVIPLSGPIIAVLSLFYAIGHWNSYFQALLYLNKMEMFPLQIVLRNILIKNSGSQNLRMISSVNYLNTQHLAELLKYSLIVVSSAPMLMIYPFVQKYFVKGVLIGSLKG